MRSIRIFLYIAVVVIRIKLSVCLMDEFMIDVNDIMSDKLMPTSLFLIEGPSVLNDNSSFLNEVTGLVAPGSVGNFQNAYATMGFHRKMINEYMCSNFVAKQILYEVAPHHIASEKGSTDESKGNKKTRSLRNSFQDTMLFDSGSRGYRDWLTKTATLDDIYRHIATQNASSSSTKHPPFRRIDGEEDYEEGQVTGYAVQQPIPVGFGRPDNHLLDGNEHIPQPIAGNKAVTPADFLFYPNSNLNIQTVPVPVPVPVPVHNSLPPAYENKNILPNLFRNKLKYLHPFLHLKEKFKNALFGHKIGQYNQQGYAHSGSGYDDYSVSYDKSSSKEMTLRDIFDIALTTLAFLSFGMFILQVIMCITVSKDTNSNMMMPMEMEEVDVGEEGFDQMEEIRRKRSIQSSSIAEINELSRKVLRSIEAAYVIDKDHGKCLQQILCDNNKSTRNRKDNQKLWVPLWGLGMSWLSSRFSTKQSPSSAILESLKAAAMGLGGANCGDNFKCDMDMLHKERKERRRKRSLSSYVFKWDI